MTATEIKEYAKIVTEVRAMAARLASLSDAGHSDMEGADMPEFAISAILWCWGSGARRLANDAAEIERLLNR